MENESGMNHDDDVVRRDANRHKHALPQLLPALVLVILAVVGNVILIRATGGSATSAKNAAALSQVFTAAMWVGAVWLGALLAYRGIMQSRR